MLVNLALCRTHCDLQSMIFSRQKKKPKTSCVFVNKNVVISKILKIQ